MLHQILKVIPLFEAQEHIRANQQGQMCIRVLALQFADGVIGIAFSAAGDLYVRDLNPVEITKGQAAKLQTLFRGRTPLLQLLMGRVIIRDNEETIGIKLLQRGQHRLAMPQVRRVKTAAVYRYIHLSQSGFLR